MEKLERKTIKDKKEGTIRKSKINELIKNQTYKQANIRAIYLKKPMQ